MPTAVEPLTPSPAPMERPDLSTIPLTPGVYLYKDESGRIIYVGKARCLRRRVASYFRDVSALTPKTVAMLRHAVTIDTLSTTTEKEALLLEASLIKKHRPRYNIVLRDDKQYVLFRIGAKHPYPRLEIVRKARRDDGRYFGPFTSASAVRETWKTIHRAFPLRRCSDRAFGNRVRACLYHHMGQCLGPCVNEVPSETYAALLEQVSLLLSGRSGELVDALRTEMEAASQGLDFERAAVLRDRIRALERTVERQAAVLPGGGDLDVVGVVEVENGLALGVLFVRQGGVLLDGRSFFWPGLGFAEAPELLWSFLGQFYGPQATIPPRIVVPWLPDEDGETGDALDGSSDAVVPVAAATTIDASLADVRTGTEVTSLINASHAAPNVGESTQGDTLAGATGKGATHLMLETALAALRGGIVRIALPRNPAENRLVDMAMSNAREEARRKADTPLQDLLARALHLAGPPHRIEAVDVSHTGGGVTPVWAWWTSRTASHFLKPTAPMPSRTATATTTVRWRRGPDAASSRALHGQTCCWSMEDGGNLPRWCVLLKNAAWGRPSPWLPSPRPARKKGVPTVGRGTSLTASSCREGPIRCRCVLAHPNCCSCNMSGTRCTTIPSASTDVRVQGPPLPESCNVSRA